MPALTSFSKEFIIEKLTHMLKEQEKEIQELKDQIAYMNRKNDHKCNDAYCPLYDGPRSEE